VILNEFLGLGLDGRALNSRQRILKHFATWNFFEEL
jgi:hypothetical protein